MGLHNGNAFGIGLLRDWEHTFPTPLIHRRLGFSRSMTRNRYPIAVVSVIAQVGVDISREQTIRLETGVVIQHTHEFPASLHVKTVLVPKVELDGAVEVSSEDDTVKCRVITGADHEFECEFAYIGGWFPELVDIGSMCLRGLSCLRKFAPQVSDLIAQFGCSSLCLRQLETAKLELIYKLILNFLSPLNPMFRVVKRQDRRLVLESLSLKQRAEVVKLFFTDFNNLSPEQA